jgi:hypothetical protein
MEDVRANRDIIVGNEQGEVKEHTPVELSYEKTAGGYQRVGEDNPLPVTTGSRARAFVTMTVSTIGDTQILAPQSDHKLVIHYICISSIDVAVADIRFRFGTGASTHRFGVAANGGTANANLTDCAWEGGIDEALIATLAAALATGVYVTIGYTEV